MDQIEITSVSSRGQVVIPQSLREKLNIQEGEKFIVIGEDNIIILKKIEMPSFSGMEKLLKKTREFAKKKGLNEADVEKIIKDVRSK